MTSAEQNMMDAARDAGAWYYRGGNGRVSTDGCVCGSVVAVRRALAVLGASFGERVAFVGGYQQDVAADNLRGRIVVFGDRASATMFYAAA